MSFFFLSVYSVSYFQYLQWSWRMKTIQMSPENVIKISFCYTSELTRFRRKRHSRYIGLWKLITNAVGLKKNSKRHIFKAQDLPFPIANSKFFNILLIMKKCCLNKKKHDFSALFFLNWVFKSFPVSNQPETFPNGGINV